MGQFNHLKITEQEFLDHGMTSLPGTKWAGQAEMLKRKLDEEGSFVGERMNEVLNLLESGEAAANIGVTPFGPYDSDTVQGLIEETTGDLQGKIDDIVAGALPSDAITTEKIRNRAVTAEKIADGVVPGKATEEEVISGTDDASYITPKTLKSSLTPIQDRSGKIKSKESEKWFVPSTVQTFYDIVTETSDQIPTNDSVISPCGEYVFSTEVYLSQHTKVRMYKNEAGAWNEIHQIDIIQHPNSTYTMRPFDIDLTHLFIGNGGGSTIAAIRYDEGYLVLDTIVKASGYEITGRNNKYINRSLEYWLTTTEYGSQVRVIGYHKPTKTFSKVDVPSGGTTNNFRALGEYGKDSGIIVTSGGTASNNNWWYKVYKVTFGENNNVTILEIISNNNLLFENRERYLAFAQNLCVYDDFFLALNPLVDPYFALTKYSFAGSILITNPSIMASRTEFVKKIIQEPGFIWCRMDSNTLAKINASTLEIVNTFPNRIADSNFSASGWTVSSSQRNASSVEILRRDEDDNYEFSSALIKTRRLYALNPYKLYEV